MPTWFEGDVYFSPRDSKNRSHIYRASFNPLTGKLGSADCYLSPGNVGCYDDAGCMVSWVKRDGPRVLCYFIGWNLSVSVPFRNCIGLAIDRNKLYGPILDRNLYDNYGVGSCCDGLRWYLSVVRWKDGRHYYHIVNGRPHSPAITFKDSTEYAIARPSVIQDSDCYRMWYCYRGDYYRIGYAESKDGQQWERKDHLAPSARKSHQENAPDDERCYPYVFDYEGRRFMLFNGEGYGRHGFYCQQID